MKKICWVCEGKNCESFIASSIFKSYLAKSKIKDIKTEAVSLLRCEKNSEVENILFSLARAGYKESRVKMFALTGKRMADANLLIALTRSQKNFFSEKEKVFTLSELTDEPELGDFVISCNKDIDDRIKILQVLISKLAKLIDKEEGI